MNHFVKSAAACCAALLLISCGSSDTTTATTPPPLQLQLASMSKSSAQTLSAADYTNVVQRVYVAYFGRPADPAGLAYFANLYLNNGVATDIAGVNKAYGNTPVVTDLINSFGVSDESSALYPGDNVAFITAIYRNLFSREPDVAGRDYWVGVLNAKNMTRAQAAVALMAGALGDDGVLITAKVNAAIAFTNALNTASSRESYDGLAANVIARNMLLGISASTPPATVESSINSAITSLMNERATLLFPAVAAIVKSRCVGCHSAQPTVPGFNPAPRGIRYDTADSIFQDRARIHATAGVGFSMPYGNLTGMTEEERAKIRQWYALVPAQ